MGPAPRPAVAPAVDMAMPMTVIREVDVRDPAAMRVVRTMRTEASYASARLTGSTARIVLTSSAPVAMTRAAIRASRTPHLAARRRRAQPAHGAPERAPSWPARRSAARGRSPAWAC